MLTTPSARQLICWLFFLFIAALPCKADTLTLRPGAQAAQKIKLNDYLSVWEDPSRSSDTAIVNKHQALFVPADQLQQQEATSYYWLRMPIKNGTDTTANLILSFSSLTLVDVYLYQKDQCILHKQAGAFRARKYIVPYDGRLFTSLIFQPGQSYELLIRVHHTKGYSPVFNFTLQQKEPFIQHLHQLKLIDAWSQGAVCLFFVYALVSWAVSRYRPYLWLLCYIGGIGLYGISTGGYLIEWVFPHHPPTGWLFNLVFVHLGSLGIYMLMMDFWQMKLYNPILYNVGRMLVIELGVVSLAGVCINYLTGNFVLVNTINLWLSVFPFSFITASLWLCWRRLTPAQRYLAYGLLLFFASAIYVVFSSALLKERSLLIAPYVSNFTTLAVFLLFATGLKEDLRQHEIDKHAALEELNRLQQFQNAILERKVEDRTSELSISNRHLKEQQALLADRNTKIETLINELNHRVKNNLQLLYGLSSLQVPMVNDEAAREIMRGNMGKIKAMMLVNEKLFRFEEQSSVHVREFTTELADHLQRIYDGKGKIRILQDIGSGIQLQGKQALSFGLILAELLTNSFKYAFPDHHDPAIRITMQVADKHTMQFTYADNGRGIDHLEHEKHVTMGISLVHDLARQMNGQITVTNGHGLTYQFLIPV
jgi:two-component sensor histidine kinase